MSLWVSRIVRCGFNLYSLMADDSRHLSTTIWMNQFQFSGICFLNSYVITYLYFISMYVCICAFGGWERIERGEREKGERRERRRD